MRSRKKHAVQRIIGDRSRVHAGSSNRIPGVLLKRHPQMFFSVDELSVPDQQLELFHATSFTCHTVCRLDFCDRRHLLRCSLRCCEHHGKLCEA